MDIEMRYVELRRCVYMYTGRSPAQYPAGRVPGRGRDGLASWQWIHQHGACHQRAGTAAEDPRRISAGVAGRPRARGQGRLLLTSTCRAGFLFPNAIRSSRRSGSDLSRSSSSSLYFCSISFKLIQFCQFLVMSRSDDQPECRAC